MSVHAWEFGPGVTVNRLRVTNDWKHSEMEQKGYRNSREKALHTMVSLYMTHPVYSSSIITHNELKTSQTSQL